MMRYNHVVINRQSGALRVRMWGSTLQVQSIPIQIVYKPIINSQED